MACPKTAPLEALGCALRSTEMCREKGGRGGDQQRGQKKGRMKTGQESFSLEKGRAWLPFPKEGQY